MELYGIPNCDQVKKARAWLEGHGFQYRFVDFKKSGVDSKKLARWQQIAGWDNLINRRGTTWRAMAEPRRADVIDARSAAALMIELPSLIKRPILVAGEHLLVGFSESDYSTLLGSIARSAS